MENEIKVNEFVRYKDGDIIQIFQKIDREYVIKDNKDRIYTLPESAVYKDIVKHSSNIIDLTKVGDVAKILDNTSGEEHHITLEDEIQFESVKETIEDGIWTLLEIYTKEMMESISYKVKE